MKIQLHIHCAVNVLPLSISEYFKMHSLKPRHCMIYPILKGIFIHGSLLFSLHIGFIFFNFDWIRIIWDSVIILKIPLFLLLCMLHLSPGTLCYFFTAVRCPVIFFFLLLFLILFFFTENAIYYPLIFYFVIDINRLLDWSWYFVPGFLIPWYESLFKWFIIRKGWTSFHFLLWLIDKLQTALIIFEMLFILRILDQGIAIFASKLNFIDKRS